MALRGNVGMLVWLGKQLLGQTDSPSTSVNVTQAVSTGHGSIPITPASCAAFAQEIDAIRPRVRARVEESREALLRIDEVLAQEHERQRSEVE